MQIRPFLRTAQGGRLLVTLGALPNPVGLRFLGPQQAQWTGGLPRKGAVIGGLVRLLATPELALSAVSFPA